VSEVISRSFSFGTDLKRSNLRCLEVMAMVSWRSYMKKRVRGEERFIPWFFHDKIRCFEWCQGMSIPTPQIFRVFPTPDDIEIPDDLARFVLKPTKFSSTRGVMVLDREMDLFLDSMSKKRFDIDGIVSLQRELAAQFSVRGNRWILEERVIDKEGHDLPLDFKAYAFCGRVELFLVIDRSTRPTSVAWFDGNLSPVRSHDVRLNPKYVQKLEGLQIGEYSEVFELSAKVSDRVNSPFARIDLYNSSRGPLLGEITLTPGGLYYGDHYNMSEGLDQLMGALWAHAATVVDERRDVLSELAYQKEFLACEATERTAVLDLMNYPFRLAEAIEQCRK